MNDKNFTISTQILLREAKKRGIKVTPIFPRRVLELTYKGHTEYIYNQYISKTTAVAYQACCDKEVAKEFLRRAEISVPSGYDYDLGQADLIIGACSKLDWLVVVKPTSSTHGNGVYMDISTKEELFLALRELQGKCKRILIEKKFAGTEYRIFATREKVLGVTNRLPANIIGDGKSTISELIEKKNLDPRRGDDTYSSYEKPLVKIEADSIVIAHLRKAGLTVDSMPAEGERIFLRENSNLSTGGDSIDFTDKIHPSVAEIAVRAIKSIPGLAYGGIDLLTKDITQEQTERSYVVLEINASPGFFMHHFPYEGETRNVASGILDIAFPETKGDSK